MDIINYVKKKNKMMYIKVRESEGNIVVAACDSEILGKRFSEGGVHLNVKEDFYKGELENLKDLGKFLSKATIANLSGNNVVDKAIDLGFVDADCVLEISGVKHAQIISMG